MSGASDIAKLFAVAGGSAAQYQEVERTEQLEGARGRWSAHADTDTDPDLAAQDEAAPDAAQPLISWSIAAVTEEPPPVVPAAQDAPAIQAANDAPVEVETQPALQSSLEPELKLELKSELKPAFEPIAEPAAQATPAPATGAPQPAALSNVFARLMERNEPRADVRTDARTHTAPRGKP
jgi:hypothetical protein